VALTTYLHLATRLKEEYSYTPTILLGLHSLFLGKLYFLVFAITCEFELMVIEKLQVRLIFCQAEHIRRAS
jgi:hypothetical protein